MAKKSIQTDAREFGIVWKLQHPVVHNNVNSPVGASILEATSGPIAKQVFVGTP
jgi:hypothetical protein